MTTSPDDPVRRRLAVGRDVGVLAIELASRRRLRINGTIEALLTDEIRMWCAKAFPTAPSTSSGASHSTRPQRQRARTVSESGRAVDEDRLALVESADTAFVGSLHPTRGVDASHRGGAPGFIRVVDATTLRVADYPGNGMFMTLGNFESRFTSEPGRGRFRARTVRLLFGHLHSSILTWRIRSTRPEAPAAIGISPCESGFKSISRRRVGSCSMPRRSIHRRRHHGNDKVVNRARAAPDQTRHAGTPHGSLPREGIRRRVGL